MVTGLAEVIEIPAALVAAAWFEATFAGNKRFQNPWQPRTGIASQLRMETSTSSKARYGGSPTAAEWRDELSAWPASKRSCQHTKSSRPAWTLQVSILRIESLLTRSSSGCKPKNGSPDQIRTDNPTADSFDFKSINHCSTVAYGYREANLLPQRF